MAWTSLDTRNPALRQLVSQVATAASPAMDADVLYNQNELGLLSDPDLQTWLQQRTAASEEPQNPAAPLEPPMLREEDLYSTRTLRWLQQNATSADDKALAKQRYRELLFDLWRKYVAHTGQAWYPPLRNDLWDRYQALVNDPDHV